MASLAIVLICAYAMAANAERIAQVGALVLGLVVVLNAAGYLAGWGLARAYGFDARHRLTLAVEIGMQNAGLGVALALQHFAAEVALPGALFAVWCILHRRRGHGLPAPPRARGRRLSRAYLTTRSWLPRTGWPRANSRVWIAVRLALRSRSRKAGTSEGQAGAWLTTS